MLKPVGKGHGRAQQKLRSSVPLLRSTFLLTLVPPMEMGGAVKVWLHFEKRAKPDAESDDFGAVWTQARRLLRLLEACKTDAESDDFGAVWTQVRRV